MGHVNLSSDEDLEPGLEKNPEEALLRCHIKKRAPPAQKGALDTLFCEEQIFDASEEECMFTLLKCVD